MCRGDNKMHKGKVLYVGHGKTGTSSFGTALEILGYRLYENDLELMKAWNSREYNKLWKVADNYDAFEDYPWPYTYKEFDKQYPGTKFILGIRPNEDEWVNSIIYQTLRAGTKNKRRLVAETHYHEYGFGKYPVLYEEQYKEAYRQHNKEVREYFKDRDDFIEITLWSKGNYWKEICDFLECKEPTLPFPFRKNAWPYPNYDKLRRMALRNPEKFYGW